MKPARILLRIVEGLVGHHISALLACNGYSPNDLPFVAFPEIQGRFLHVACNRLVPVCTSIAPTGVEKATPVTSLEEFSWISSTFFVSYAGLT